MAKRSIKRDDKKDFVRIRHMLDASREIRKFCRDVDFQGFRDNRMLNLAVLKDIEIIGEAASKVSLEFREEFANVPWQAIVDTRNRLVHGYFDVDLKVLWDTVRRDIPGLIQALQGVLQCDNELS